MSNRDIAATWRYHLATNHSPERLRATPHFLDPATRPLPYKIYTSLPPLPLPDAPASFTMPALDAIAATDEAPADERRVLGPAGPAANAATDEATGGGERVPDLAALGWLCRHSNGITRYIRRPGQVYAMRAAACTGAPFHVEPYLLC